MNKLNEDQIIYLITSDDMQDFVERKIGRRLNESELRIAKKCIEYGFSEGLDAVCNSAIDEALSSK